MLENLPGRPGKVREGPGLLFEETSAIIVVKVKKVFEGQLQVIYNVKAQSGETGKRYCCH